jgi:DNA invertase Pin-like site-specific DNA recombinase
MTRPAAYLRKSKDAATKADHLAMLMRAVHAHGHNGDTIVYDDWARSGDIDKIAARTEWKRLCDAIERGEHDVVFMNSLDRGGRSIEEWLRFIRLARSKNVRVIADGVDYSASENRDRLIFESWAAEKELERAKERSARTRRLREARGDATTGGNHAAYGAMWLRAGDVGEPGDPRRLVSVPNPAEPLEPVVAVLAETGGSVMAAARLLNQRGIAGRDGRPWTTRTLQRVADREGLVRKTYGARRRRAPSAAPLSKIVQCHCGAIMTPERDRRTGAWAALSCSRGRQAGAEAHGKNNARARHIVDFLKSQVRYSTVRIERAAPTNSASERAKLEDRRRKLGIALADDAIAEDEYRQRIDAIKAALAKLDDDASAEDWTGFSAKEPLVDWSADDAAIGERLRKLVRSVRLDEGMMPIEVDWRAPWLRKAKARQEPVASAP